MLHPDDLRAVRSRFGAADEQVRRDHLIAHLLAAVQHCDAGDVVAVGGAALGLTWLPEGRLTENVDLLAEPRAAVGAWLVRELPHRLRREFPGLLGQPCPGPVPGPVPGAGPAPGAGSGVALDAGIEVGAGPPPDRVPEPVCVRTPDGLLVRVRLLAPVLGGGGLPVRRRRLRIRYRDVAPVELAVPTGPAFAVLKAAAWRDRRAPRDLFDLSGLVSVGAVDADAAGLARQLLGRPLRGQDFGPPVPADWRAQLAHQTARLPDPRECLAVVGAAWERAAADLPPAG